MKPGGRSDSHKDAQKTQRGFGGVLPFIFTFVTFVHLCGDRLRPQAVQKKPERIHS
jgi:hypothetical protein